MTLVTFEFTEQKLKAGNTVYIRSLKKNSWNCQQTDKTSKSVSKIWMVLETVQWTFQITTISFWESVFLSHTFQGNS